MSSKLLEIDTPLIRLKECYRFIKDCMQALGTPTSHSEALADLLVEADYRGHYSHGMNRLELYIDEIQHGVCDPNAVPEIIKETPATAWVHGNHGLGAVVGNFSMDLAIKKAKIAGVGWVVAKSSNHYGIAGFYALKAIKENLLGLSFTNTSPVVPPTRAKTAALGTNPISLGAAALNGDSFVLDMATSAVAYGKIEMQHRKNEPLPNGWSQDENGKSITNPATALSSGFLCPLGGEEIHSGYKGYGLAVLVEIFCGILGDANFGPGIRKFRDPSSHANLGQCFIAVDPKCFAPGFEERLSSLLDYLRNMESTDPYNPVLVAGDPEKMHMKAVDEAGGIRYVTDQLNTCRKIAKALKVQPLKPL